jgi:DNA-binding transcriptional MerR regulator
MDTATPQHDSKPGFLTTAEVAQRYRTAPSTIRYWRHIGYLRAGTRYGRRTLYRLEDLDAWDREREAEDDRGAAIG